MICYNDSMRDKISIVKRRIYYHLFPPSEEKYGKLLKKWFYNQTGQQIDFKDIKNFNQFIQWLKVFDNKKYKTNMTDKYAMRRYVKDNIGEEYLVRLYGVYDEYSEIVFEKLPQKFVLKCNHGCGMNVIVRDKDEIDNSSLKKQFNGWMRVNYAFEHYPGIEPQYRGIRPRIICEEYLGDNLVDIQFWCSRGEVLFISYIDHPHGENKKASFDEKWNRLDFVTSLPENKEIISKPKRLNEMLKIAKRVSADMEFLRFDFYILENGDVKISEFTFTPANGLVGWHPKSASEAMYKKILEIRGRKEHK